MAIKQITNEPRPSGAWPKEFLCDTDADFVNLPEAITGSTAVSIQSGRIRIVNTQGEWVPFGEQGA